MWTFIYYGWIREGKKIWFAKSPFHNLTQSIIINIPLSYMSISVAVIWVGFTLTLIQMLIDDSIVYPVLYPDLMYGLQDACDIFIRTSTILLLISFLPTILLLREKQKKFNKIYYISFLFSILFIILTYIVLYLFDVRFENIQTNAIRMIIKILPINLDMIEKGINLPKLTASLQYYYVMMNLPNGIPNSFFSSLLSIKTIAIFIEIIFLLFPNLKKKAAELITDMRGK